MFIIKLLSQHVSGIIMPIVRRIRPCPAACGVLPGRVGYGWLWLCGAVSWAVCAVWNSNFHTVLTAHDAVSHNQSQPQPTHPDRTPHAVVHGIILLMIGIMMPESCWDRSLIINIELVASCSFSLFKLWYLCQRQNQFSGDNIKKQETKDSIPRFFFTPAVLIC